MSKAFPSGYRRSVRLSIALAAALVLLFAFSVSAFAQSAHESIKTSASVTCDDVRLTFSVSNNFAWVFEYKIDNETGTPDFWTTYEAGKGAGIIPGGPLENTPWGNRFNAVIFSATDRSGKYETQVVHVPFTRNTGVHSLSYRLVRGAENDYYFDWQTLTVNTNCDFDSIANPIPPSLSSLGYQATSTKEYGDYIELVAGSGDQLTSLTVALVNWACQTGSGTACTTVPGSTFPHTITLNIYNPPAASGDLHPGSLIKSVTRVFDIPYRPSADPTCSDNTQFKAVDTGTCHSGVTAPVTFDLVNENIVVPQNFVVSFAYNTQSHGYQPIGTAGPYNSLNVGLSPTIEVGEDLDDDGIYWYTSHLGFYSDDGNPDPNTFRRDSGWAAYKPAIEITSASDCTTDCYVAPGGDDTWPGSEDYPKKTIQGGVNAVAAGGTVHVADGAYTETVAITKKLSLLAESHNTIVDGAIRISGSNSSGVVIDGFTIKNGVSGLGTHAAIYISGDNDGHTITNNRVIGIASPTVQTTGIEVSHNTDNLTIAHNYVQDWTYGIYINGVAGSGGNGHQIYLNTFNTYYGAIGLDGTQNTTVRNNLFEGPLVEYPGYPGYWSASVTILKYKNPSQTGTNVFENSFPAGMAAIKRSHINESPYDTIPAGGAIEADSNWWGQDTGPAAGQFVINDGGAVNAASWLPAGTNIVPAGEPGFIYGGQIYMNDQSGLSGQTLSVPIYAEDALAFTGGTIDFTYDPTKVEILSVGKGSGIPGLAWGFFVNYAWAPNTVRLSFVNSTPSTPVPNMELAVVQVKLIGNPGDVATLDMIVSQLDYDGVTKDIENRDGVLTIIGPAIGGAVRDWGATTNGIDGVTMTLARTDTSAADSVQTTSGGGLYTFANTPAGSYTLTPDAESIQVCDPAPALCSINGQDGSLVMSHHVGLALLSGNGLIAGDVNSDGVVTTLDATLILQRATHSITSYPNAPLWKFVPANKSYVLNSSSSDLLAENFTAILMGDVNGSWDPQAVTPVASVTSDASVAFSTPRVAEDGTVQIDLVVDPGSAGLATSVDVALSYDADNFSLEASTLADGWMADVNAGTSGLASISSATAYGVPAGTTVMTLSLHPTGTATDAAVKPEMIAVNGETAFLGEMPEFLPSFRILLPFLQGK